MCVRSTELAATYWAGVMYQTREDEFEREAYGEAGAVRGAFMQAMSKCLLHEGCSSPAEARCDAAFEADSDDITSGSSKFAARIRVLDDGRELEVEPARGVDMRTVVSRTGVRGVFRAGTSA